MEDIHYMSANSTAHSPTVNEGARHLGQTLPDFYSVHEYFDRV